MDRLLVHGIFASCGSRTMRGSGRGKGRILLRGECTLVPITEERGTQNSAEAAWLPTALTTQLVTGYRSSVDRYPQCRQQPPSKTRGEESYGNTSRRVI